MGFSPRKPMEQDCKQPMSRISATKLESIYPVSCDLSDYHRKVIVGRAEQAVSERLSRHVLKNWQRFVEGIHEVATIEQDLQVTTLTMWCVSAALV